MLPTLDRRRRWTTHKINQTTSHPRMRRSSYSPPEEDQGGRLWQIWWRIEERSEGDECGKCGWQCWLPLPLAAIECTAAIVRTAEEEEEGRRQW